MDNTSLTALADELATTAASEGSGRAARTIHGGHQHTLRQTVIALNQGTGLQEHANPGEATLQVVRGRIRFQAGTDQMELGAGDYLVIPDDRHSLDALEASVILLTTTVAATS